MKKIITFFFLLFGLLTGVSSQELVPPLDIPLYLSGNFGELRSNHFHSGIDFKTQGVVGLPIKSVKEGYVSRINVSPYGYGNAMYIDHQDGTTSLYAHLDKFIPRFENIVRDSQYVKESFAVTLYFLPDQLPVGKGEKIAYGGNTGSSGGPHLHFELRETDTEDPIDPLPFFKNKIKDTQTPEIRGLMIFPQINKGVVNGSSKDQEIPLQKDNAGKPTVNALITAWGEIGVGIKAYDRMDETSNIYGVYEVILKVNGEEVYHSIMDKFSFRGTRYLNTYVDWSQWIENKAFFMKSFTDPGNRLGINKSLHNGIVNIDKEKDYLFEYTLKDIYGNASTLDFNIAGIETPISEYHSDDPYFLFNRDNRYTGMGIELSIPRGNLYSNTYVRIDTSANYTPFSSLYKIGERIPLHDYCSLSLDIENDYFPDKSKYGIVYNWKKNKNWLGGNYENGKMKTRIRELGNFSIEVDTIPPVIRPVNEAKWEVNKRITFKITDNLSGIASYKGYLNDRFVLFEYDAKTNSLYCVYDPKRMNKGKQLLRLVVSDSAGNESVYSKTITF